jgi:hypothetical protein
MILKSPSFEANGTPLELSGNRLAALCCQLEVAGIAGTSTPSITTSKSRVLR